MTINILSRQEIVDFLGVTTWKFELSSSDASSVQSWHYGLVIDTSSTLASHASLPVSPWSEIYTSSTLDPYNLVWSVYNGGGSSTSYLNFIKPISSPEFVDINNWGNFVWNAVGPTGGTGSTIPLPITDEIRDRTPYLYLSQGTSSTSFSETNFLIREFEGDKNTFASQSVSYSITKSKITHAQTNIFINLSNLAKEKMEGSIDNFVYVPDYTTALKLAPNESKWLSVETTNYYLSATSSQALDGFFVVDGYCEAQNNHILPNVLMSGKTRLVHRTSRQRIYFKTYGLSAASYTIGLVTTPITWTTFNNNNNEYIQSIPVDIPLTEDKVVYNFTYPFNVETVTYNIYDDCKYEKYDLVFKNKYGMLESLPMSKKSSKTLSITSTDYNRGIVNYDGLYNLNRHTLKQLNVTGDEEWTLNTDIFPDYMNEPIKETLLTEEMWLIDEVGTISPVVRVDNTITFKTSLNDKMIQYTIKVKLSHRTIKNIQ